ncbi:MAG: hypothetical protein M3042_12855 [Actinomycetota bacterium]|nr:hypothetical protein [Actinomycetota bacterium]
MESSVGPRNWVSPKTALMMGAVALLLMAAGAPLSLMAHQFDGWLAQFPLMAPFVLVGLLIARRQPNNPIGWIMLALATIYTLGADAGSYAVLAFRLGHPSLPLARLAVALTQCWIALPVLLPLPIALFPDGRLPSRRWRATIWVYSVVCVTLLIGTAIKDVPAFTDRHVQVDGSGELLTFSGSSGGAVDAVGPLLFLVLAGISLSWVIRQLVAYRRSTRVRRQQLKWLVSGGAIAITGFALALLFGNSTNPVLRVLAGGFFGIIAVPVSIGIGVLKYRLYEIDRVISRTLAYAIVTGLLVGVYVALITVSTRALSLSSPLGVAGSTLAAAALFAPLRRRVQRAVDRRFNRSRYDTDATIAAFSARLRTAIDLEQVQREFLGVVQHAVEPSQASVWIRSRSSTPHVGLPGRSAPALDASQPERQVPRVPARHPA